MNLRFLRFATIMFTAVTMSDGFAHLMELLPKMRYEKSQYVMLHRTLYWNYGRIAGVAEILSLLTAVGLAWLVRRRDPRAFPLSASAAGSLAAHAVFWVYVSPANSTMISWPMESIPPQWERWRDQWEYSHAVRACLVTGALGLLAASTLLPAGPTSSGGRVRDIIYE